MPYLLPKLIFASREAKLKDEGVDPSGSSVFNFIEISVWLGCVLVLVTLGKATSQVVYLCVISGIIYFLADPGIFIQFFGLIAPRRSGF